MNLSNKPLISVIIPYYNHNRFVKKNLDSILEKYTAEVELKTKENDVE